MGKKNAQEQDLTVSNTDGSYLNEVSQAMSKSDELLSLQSQVVGTEAMLSMFVRFEESNCQIMMRMERIEGNSMVSSTPILCRCRKRQCDLQITKTQACIASEEHCRGHTTAC